MEYFKKYVDRQTKQIVTALKYNDITDFPKLKQLIGDVYPNIAEAQTRTYEGKWIIRYENGEVKFMQCPSGDLCFNKRFEVYK